MKILVHEKNNFQFHFNFPKSNFLILSQKDSVRKSFGQVQGRVRMLIELNYPISTAKSAKTCNFPFENFP